MTIRLDSKFSEQTNTYLAYSQGGLKLAINIPPKHILAKSKGGLIIEGGVISSMVYLAIYAYHVGKRSQNIFVIIANEE